MTPEGWLYLLIGCWLSWRLILWLDREEGGGRTSFDGAPSWFTFQASCCDCYTLVGEYRSRSDIPVVLGPCRVCGGRVELRRDWPIWIQGLALK